MPQQLGQFWSLETHISQHSLSYPFLGNQTIRMYTNIWVILRDFHCNNALFGLVSYHDPCILKMSQLWPTKIQVTQNPNSIPPIQTAHFMSVEKWETHTHDVCLKWNTCEAPEEKPQVPQFRGWRGGWFKLCEGGDVVRFCCKSRQTLGKQTPTVWWLQFFVKWKQRVVPMTNDLAAG